MSTLLNRPIASLNRPGAPALTDVIPMARAATGAEGAVIGLTYGDLLNALNLLFAPVGGGSSASMPMSTLEREDAEMVYPVPGATGPTGATGAAGLPVLIPGFDGEDGDPSLIPGPQGVAGAAGVTAPGPSGVDGEDGADAIMVPGATGATGSAGANGQAGRDPFTFESIIDLPITLNEDERFALACSL